MTDFAAVEEIDEVACERKKQNNAGQFVETMSPRDLAADIVSAGARDDRGCGGANVRSENPINRILQRNQIVRRQCHRETDRHSATLISLQDTVYWIFGAN